MRKLGLRCWKIQCAWSGFFSELGLFWRLMEAKMKRRCISRARKSEFVRVSKYEQKVNSRKVWVGLRPKFFAKILREIRIGSNSNKKDWLCLRSKMFAKKWNSESAIWPTTLYNFQNYVFSEVYFEAGGNVRLRKSFI